MSQWPGAYHSDLRRRVSGQGVLPCDELPSVFVVLVDLEHGPKFNNVVHRFVEGLPSPVALLFQI